MCVLFFGFNCSYGCRRSGYDLKFGICFCELGYKFDSDGKICNGIEKIFLFLFLF